MERMIEWLSISIYLENLVSKGTVKKHAEKEISGWLLYYLAVLSKNLNMKKINPILFNLLNAYLLWQFKALQFFF